ncbi:MAG: cytochrome b/b6 domain-containing protein [Pseudomonadales bacterium]|nr:cytochrome b/b6 domain-containing protein [Pseudomonadales bacterium]
MTLMDADNRYGAVSRALHWSMALLLLGMLASELWFEVLEHRLSGADLMALHQSLGVVLLVLVIVRVGWRWLNRSRLAVPAHWALAAKAGHVVLYLLMLLMPLSGLAIAIGEGDSVALFGWTLLDAGSEIAWLEDSGENLHKILANVFWLMIGLHVAAALIHQHLLDDKVLKRMA